MENSERSRIPKTWQAGSALWGEAEAICRKRTSDLERRLSGRRRKSEGTPLNVGLVEGFRMWAAALRSQPGGTAARVGKPHKEETAGFSAVALWGKRVRPCCGEARSIGRDRAERRCDGPWVRGPVGFRVLRCHCVPDGQSKRPARARDSAGRCRAVAKRGAVERADADGERHAALVGGGARDRGA